MGSDRLVLGFDTSAAHCAAALLCGDRVLAARAEDMGRGQAERLMPFLQDMLTDNSASWADLWRLGVGTGPGNFTGIRISVSAARGLALALGIPAVGVSTFDAITKDRDGAHLPAIPAPRGQIYIRPVGEAPRLASPGEAEAAGVAVALPPEPDRLAIAIARLAASAKGKIAAPAPLYVRPADAAPPREAPPVILDDDA